MTGVKLHEVIDFFAKMPTEEFLAQFMRSEDPSASVMVTGRGVVERGPEVVSGSTLPVNEVAVVGAS